MTRRIQKSSKNQELRSKIDPLPQLAQKQNILYSCPMSQTYQPKKRKRARTHGFLVRSKTPGGRAVLKSRARKGRARLTVKSPRTKV